VLGCVCASVFACVSECGKECESARGVSVQVCECM
jgi:hypothetical protein